MTPPATYRLSIKADGQVLGEFAENKIPSERVFSQELSADSILQFVDGGGQTFEHNLGKHAGWFHFSVRVNRNQACQADCVITDHERFDLLEFAKGAPAIRFQPFFLHGAEASNESFAGKGLFARGLHFVGRVTPSNVTISSICDRCRGSFHLKSFHNGFGDTAHFYSGSGIYTLIVSSNIEGVPSPISVPDVQRVEALEAMFPKAPDGTNFSYANSLRCPHCGEAYIDFQKYPEERVREYYGNYIVGTEPTYYPAR